MDEAVINYYRRLLKEEFPNSGEIEEPTIFIEAVGQKMINCGNTGNFMQLYFKIENDRILELKYLCSCEPVANVGVEVLCELVKGKTLQEAAELDEEYFFRNLGSRSEEYAKKVFGLLELLKEGIADYYMQTGQENPTISQSTHPPQKITWDGALSN